MCGIAGFFGETGAFTESTLHSMIATLRHRGPEGFGTIVENGVGLAHARLSIVDIEGGRQPICNEDRSVWITCNGEIFNHIELRQKLEERGHIFSTRSDVEVILHLYEEEGEDCVRSLNGQWAFAIWDKRQRRVLLSRDRMGIMPLFYTQVGRTFLWASEIKALFAVPSVNRNLDLAALDQIFTFWVPLAPRTMFSAVRLLPPGSSMRVEPDYARPSEYWKLDFAADEPREKSDAYVDNRTEELVDLLADATRIRLRSDVPVGCYLSGGLDSSLVAALARSICPNTLRSFSVAFEDPELDESRYQAEVSDHLGTNHLSLRVTKNQLAAVFPEVVFHAEMPLLRAAPAPLFLLSYAAKSAGYKVVLTGEGADEIFGGYDIFKESKVRQFWARDPNSRRRPQLLKRLYPYMSGLQSQTEHYLREFFGPGDLSDPFDSHKPRWELTSGLKALFSNWVKSELQTVNCYRDIEEAVPSGFSAWDSLSRAQFLETRFLLPGYILAAQGDRMSMAHSIEGRHPMLDHRIVEFATRLPATMRMRGLQEKYLLKRAARGLLPESIIRRPKQPFRAPDGKSFFSVQGTDYVSDCLSADALKSAGLFDAAKIETLVQKFRKGQAQGVRDNMALMGVLSTQLLVRLMAGSPSNFRPSSDSIPVGQGELPHAARGGVTVG
jgi:asparagine synthase (glutamine-hydrolysing)